MIMITPNTYILLQSVIQITRNGANNFKIFLSDGRFFDGLTKKQIEPILNNYNIS